MTLLPLRILLAALGFAIWAAASGATCTGPSLYDMMPAAERDAALAEARDVPFATGLRWIARKGDRRIDIVGTLHLDDPRFDVDGWLPETVAASDLVLFETTVSEMQALERKIGENPRLALIQSGPSLLESQPPETWDRLAEAGRRQGTPPWMLARMQPWFAFATLAIPHCAVSGKDPLNGLDRRIDSFAQHHDVPVLSLEPVTTLRHLFEALSPADLTATLDLLAVGTLDAAPAFLATREAYFAQTPFDVIPLGLWQATARGGLGTDAARHGWAVFERELISKRNHSWLPVILGRREHRLLVAVGALHLPGEDGVLNLLARAGYRLERAPF